MVVKLTTSVNKSHGYMGVIHLALGTSSSVAITVTFTGNTAIGAVTKQTMAWLWFSLTAYTHSVGSKLTSAGWKKI